MKKSMKKLTSMALAATMALSLMAPAAWANEKPVSNVIATSSQTLSDEKDQELILYTEDYENGDAKVSLVENGVLIYGGYLDRSENVIINHDYVTGCVDTQSCETAITNVARASGISTGYINQGKITYNYYIQGMVAGQKYLDVAYNKTTNPYATYDVAGKYTNIADLVLVLTGAYGLLSKTATTVAKQILDIAGFAVGTTNFVLSKFPVDAVKTTMEWKGSVSGKQMSKVTGMKYDFVLQGKNSTQYEQLYHGENSYKEHDRYLAEDLFTYAWGNDLFDIVSWS